MYAKIAHTYTLRREKWNDSEDSHSESLLPEAGSGFRPDDGRKEKEQKLLPIQVLY